MNGLIKFKNRSSSDILNQNLFELFGKSPQHDVDLLASNGKIVPAHRIVLSMYSKYFQKIFAHSTPDSKLIVVLNIFPNIVLEKVMELFYFGQICVLGALKNKVMKALEFLQVKSLYVPNSHHIPILTHAVQSAIKQPENQFQTTNASNTKRPAILSKTDPKQQAEGLHNSDSGCTKHQTPTEQVVTSLENVNASLILPTEKTDSSKQNHNQQLINDVSSNTLEQKGTDSILASVKDKSNNANGIGVNLLYDGINDNVNELYKSAKDLIEDTII